jgi:multidrug transporter EmrE-like cation transporter
MFILQQFNLSGLGWGGLMALMDSIVLSSLKAFNIGWIQWKGTILVSMLVYSLQPLIFLESLKGNGLTIMNLLWDVMSDVIVTAIGLFYFSEKLTTVKRVGVLLSFISVILLSWKDKDDN